MKKYFILTLGMLLVSIPAYSYFGSSPFGQEKFGTNEFGQGGLGEGVTSAVPVGGNFIFVDGNNFVFADTNNFVYAQ